MLVLDLMPASYWVMQAEPAPGAGISTAPADKSADKSADNPTPDLLEFLGEFAADSGEVVDARTLANLPAPAPPTHPAEPAPAEPARAPR